MIRNLFRGIKKWFGGLFKGRSRSRASGDWLQDLDRANAEASAGPRKTTGRHGLYFTARQWQKRKRMMYMVRDSRRGNRA